MQLRSITDILTICIWLQTDLIRLIVCFTMAWNYPTKSSKCYAHRVRKSHLARKFVVRLTVLTAAFVETTPYTAWSLQENHLGKTKKKNKIISMSFWWNIIICLLKLKCPSMLQAEQIQIFVFCCQNSVTATTDGFSQTATHLQWNLILKKINFKGKRIISDHFKIYK